MTGPPPIRPLHHLPGGRIICQMCVEVKGRGQLQPVSDDPDKVWDVCRECAQREGGEW